MRRGTTRALADLWIRALGGAVAATRVDRVTVTGLSMAPALLPGDRLLVLRTRRVRVGDTVVVRDPRDPSFEVVKRVTALSPDGAVTVRGDHAAASTDSRTYGPVPPALIVGRAIYRYAPPTRTGRIERSGHEACGARFRVALAARNRHSFN
ncbi:MAG: nickel-type superoxide dismutase maturation protease, partial [Egibacteraceae bacterium]